MSVSTYRRPSNHVDRFDVTMPRWYRGRDPGGRRLTFAYSLDAIVKESSVLSAAKFGSVHVMPSCRSRLLLWRLIARCCNDQIHERRVVRRAGCIICTVVHVEQAQPCTVRAGHCRILVNDGTRGKAGCSEWTSRQHHCIDSQDRSACVAKIHL